MIDQFVLNFGLPLEQQELVKRYLSPRRECSTFKYVPLGQIDEMKLVFKRLTGMKPRVVYRGPRYNGSYSTRRCHATHASIYTSYR